MLLPALPGALSAVGVLLADVVKEQSRTVMLEVTPDATSKLNRVFREMEAQATEVLRREGFSRARQKHERALAVRYTKASRLSCKSKRQAETSPPPFIVRTELAYGYAQEKNAVEIVSARVRVQAIGLRKSAKVAFKKVLDRRPEPARVHRDTICDRRKISAPVYRRANLRAGSRLRTPCIPLEYSGDDTNYCGLQGHRRCSRKRDH